MAILCLAGLFVLVVAIAGIRGEVGPGLEKCTPATWLAGDAEPGSCGTLGVLYDGSKVPDCSALQGQDSNTTFYHVHEYGEIYDFDMVNMGFG